MERDDIQKIEHGLYRVYWEGDDHTSVAAVGSTSNGDRWLAPTNWISPDCKNSSWRAVKRVEKINVESMASERKSCACVLTKGTSRERQVKTLGARVPFQYVVVSGAGQSNFGPGNDPYETASYDIALQDAGIENCNIVKYTSVIPPGAEMIPMSEAIQKGLFHHGMVLESIMAQVNGKNGEHLCAGVGTMKVMKRTDDGSCLVGGFAAEYEGHETEDKASHILRQALTGIFDRRYGNDSSYYKTDIETHTESLVVDDDFGTVLVALGFLTFTVSEF